MSTEITKEEWEETNRKVQKLFYEFEVNTIKKMPLWMRLNYYGNKIGKAISDGHEDKDIKWDYINEMLTKDLSIFDYNMFEPVHSWEEFCNLRFDVIAASEGVGPWHKHKCKDCGKEFYMQHNEVVFYQEKGLNLPKRCKECREKRKNNPAK